MLGRAPLSTVVRICAALIVAGLIIPAVPDVDLWGHTLFGGDIIRDRTVHAVDHYSFTSDRSWINHEWLSEVLMHAAYAVLGGAGLFSLRLLLVALLLWIVWREIARAGVRADAALVVLTIVALITYPRTQHMRPQLFSLVAFAALLSELMTYERTRSLARLWSVAVLMLAWANLHGGFIVGFLPICLWTVAFVLAPRGVEKRSLAAGCVLAIATLATLVNPYGLELWRFLTNTVGLQRNDITEWWPMPRAGGGVFAMWAVTVGLALAGMRLQPRPVGLHRVALVVMLAFASFRVNRLDAFFVIATIMCFGQRLAVLLSTRPVSRSRPLAPRMAVAVLALCLCGVAVSLVRASPARVGCPDMVAWLPEQDAATFVERENLHGRMIVFFDWGEYVLWHFSPNLKVSTDGRRETVYSQRHINGHLELYHGTDAGLAYARELNADYVWLPKISPAIVRLQREGWVQIYGGTRSSILARDVLRRVSTVGTRPPSCFAGNPNRPSPLSSGLWRKM